MMLCETCHAQVMADKLTDEKNFVADAETLFDTICVGCTDINRPLIDDMAGSESRCCRVGRLSFICRFSHRSTCSLFPGFDFPSFE